MGHSVGGTLLVLGCILGSGVDSIDSECDVTQLHISPGTPVQNSMWISWVTQGNCTSVVEVENDSMDDDDEVRRILGSEVASRYAFSGACIKNYTEPYVAECPYESAFLHHVQLTGLSTQTTYSYRAGGRLVTAGAGTPEAFSEARHFTTPLPAGATEEPLRFAVVGDLGQTTFSEKTMAEVSASRRRSSVSTAVADDESPEPAVLMLVGDLSYADGEGERWDAWGELFSPLLSELPLVAFPGNHEVEFDATRNTSFLHWRKRFRMPEVKPEVISPGTDRIVDIATYAFDFTYEYGSSYFSFDMGGVHAVCLNAYAHSEEGSAQYEWLKEDLESLNRNITPWVIAFTHGPWYNSNEVHQGETATLAAKSSMEPLLHSHGAAAVFAGHVHAYERTHPVSPASPSTESHPQRSSGSSSSQPVVQQGGVRDDVHGVVYVTIGDGGNREGLYDGWIVDESEEPPDWVDFRNGSHYGRGDLLVVNATHLRWEWWPNSAMEPEDMAWITNPYFRLGLSPVSAQTPAQWWLSEVLRRPMFWCLVLLMWLIAISVSIVVWRKQAYRFEAIRAFADDDRVENWGGDDCDVPLAGKDGRDHQSDSVMSPLGHSDEESASGAGCNIDQKMGREASKCDKESHSSESSSENITEM